MNLKLLSGICVAFDSAKRMKRLMKADCLATFALARMKSSVPVAYQQPERANHHDGRMERESGESAVHDVAQVGRQFARAGNARQRCPGMFTAGIFERAPGTERSQKPRRQLWVLRVDGQDRVGKNS